MRRILWIILAVLLVAISAPNAHAQTVTYAITFSLAPGAPGPLPDYGYFVYDHTANRFLSFIVSYNGQVFDLTSAANNPFNNTSLPCLSGATGALVAFDLMSVCADADPVWYSDGAPVSPPGPGGDFGFINNQSHMGEVMILGSVSTGSFGPPNSGFFSIYPIQNWHPPMGGAYGQIIRIVAGPLRVPPGVPVEVNLGFADINGNKIGPSSTVPLLAGETAILDLDMDTLLQLPGQKVEVRPLVTVVNANTASGTAAVPPAVPAVTEVFDRLTGFGTVLVPDNSVSFRPPAFDFQGVAGGQTMRLMLVAFPFAPCDATVSFADRAGNALGQGRQVNLAPGTAMPVDLNADSLGLKLGQLIEVLPTVSVTQQVVGAAHTNSYCQASVQVFDNRTGRTWTYQAGERESIPQ
jgi:hypothetical protein